MTGVQTCALPICQRGRIVVHVGEGDRSRGDCCLNPRRPVRPFNKGRVADESEADDLDHQRKGRERRKAAHHGFQGTHGLVSDAGKVRHGPCGDYCATAQYCYAPSQLQQMQSLRYRTLPGHRRPRPVRPSPYCLSWATRAAPPCEDGPLLSGDRIHNGCFILPSPPT